MKKIFTTLAFTLCLTAMVSCGGDKKENKNSKRTEQSVSSISNSTIKSKSESIVRRAAEAAVSGNYDAYQQIIQEEQEFASKLTQEQIEYYNQCALEYADKMMSNY
ncbi:MAG: hypothetical protein IIW77_02830 [Bacteroidaceae bacterium]|nr:hypothetical protein [Bacteroidaceae bacterium]